MSRKGFVLTPFLIIFSSLIIMINTIAVNEFRRFYELKQAFRIDTFSLVEIETIQLIKQQFLTFNPKNFTNIIGKWTIEVIFSEETAFITYINDTSIDAQLDYDMVFKNVLNYSTIATSKSNSD